MEDCIACFPTMRAPLGEFYNHLKEYVELVGKYLYPIVLLGGSSTGLVGSLGFWKNAHPVIRVIMALGAYCAAVLVNYSASPANRIKSELTAGSVKGIFLKIPIQRWFKIASWCAALCSACLALTAPARFVRAVCDMGHRPFPKQPIEPYLAFGFGVAGCNYLTSADIGYKAPVAAAAAVPEIKADFQVNPIETVVAVGLALTWTAMVSLPYIYGLPDVVACVGAGEGSFRDKAIAMVTGDPIHIAPENNYLYWIIFAILAIISGLANICALSTFTFPASYRDVAKPLIRAVPNPIKAYQNWRHPSGIAQRVQGNTGFTDYVKEVAALFLSSAYSCNFAGFSQGVLSTLGVSNFALAISMGAMAAFGTWFPSTHRATRAKIKGSHEPLRNVDYIALLDYLSLLYNNKEREDFQYSPFAIKLEQNEISSWGYLILAEDNQRVADSLTITNMMGYLYRQPANGLLTAAPFSTGQPYAAPDKLSRATLVEFMSLICDVKTLTEFNKERLTAPEGTVNKKVSKVFEVPAKVGASVSLVKQEFYFDITYCDSPKTPITIVISTIAPSLPLLQPGIQHTATLSAAQSPTAVKPPVTTTAVVTNGLAAFVAT